MTGAKPPVPDPGIVSAVFQLAREKLAARDNGLVVLGICGSQGSGKSTLAKAVLQQCAEQGIAAASLSIDDLYLTKAERERLGRDVHPLLRTRGVPGTHDVALGLDVISQLDRGLPAALPRFDKARDDRTPQGEWPAAPENCRLLVFEGWCVGARPEADAALRQPVNTLEETEDADGIWRRYANVGLAGDYQRLFARIDALVLLAAPGFDVVLSWRMQQEEELRQSAGEQASDVMDAAGVARFIRHYERLTCHILSEMPDRADLVIRLARDRRPLSIERRS